MPFTTPDHRKAYYRRYWREHWHYQGSVPDDDLPPGQYVAHCQAWHLVTTIPYTCPRCGHRFFEEDKTP